MAENAYMRLLKLAVNPHAPERTVTLNLARQEEAQQYLEELGPTHPLFKLCTTHNALRGTIPPPLQSSMEEAHRMQASAAAGHPTQVRLTPLELGRAVRDEVGPRAKSRTFSMSTSRSHRFSFLHHLIDANAHLGARCLERVNAVLGHDEENPIITITDLFNHYRTTCESGARTQPLPLFHVELLAQWSTMEQFETWCEDHLDMPLLQGDLYRAKRCKFSGVYHIQALRELKLGTGAKSFECGVQFNYTLQSGATETAYGVVRDLWEVEDALGFDHFFFAEVEQLTLTKQPEKDTPLRFDLVDITKRQTTHVENPFINIDNGISRTVTFGPYYIRPHSTDSTAEGTRARARPRLFLTRDDFVEIFQDRMKKHLNSNQAHVGAQLLSRQFYRLTDSQAVYVVVGSDFGS